MPCGVNIRPIALLRLMAVCAPADVVLTVFAVQTRIFAAFNRGMAGPCAGLEAVCSLASYHECTFTLSPILTRSAKMPEMTPVLIPHG